jgi:pilus assembly protein CpaB
MRSKPLLLGVAGVAGMIAAIGASQWMQAQNTVVKTTETVEIFVAVNDIDVSEEITAENIKLEKWPADRVPNGALRELGDLEGKYANQRLFAGEPLMARKLMDSMESTSLKIPRGYSVVSLQADAAASVANLVRPGDRVNVIGFFRKNDVIPESMTKTVLTGVRVFAIDGRTVRSEDEDSGKSARTISLLIHKEDEEAWTWANELGKVRLSLGRPDEFASKGEDGNSSGVNAAGQEFLAWLADHQKTQEERRNPPQPALPSIAALAARAFEAPVAPQKEESFRMVKMSGEGLTTVYEWTAGNPVPKVISGDDRAAAEKSSRSGSSASTSGPPSPFFESDQETPFASFGDAQGDGDKEETPDPAKTLE